MYFLDNKQEFSGIKLAESKVFRYSNFKVNSQVIRLCLGCFNFKTFRLFSDIVGISWRMTGQGVPSWPSRGNYTFALGCPIFTLFLNWATPLLPLRLMGCRSSQKKIQRYRPKIDIRRKIFVFDPIYKGKRAKIGPKINKIEIWLKSGSKVINSPNQSHRSHIWGMFEL